MEYIISSYLFQWHWDNRITSQYQLNNAEEYMKKNPVTKPENPTKPEPCVFLALYYM